MRTRGKVFVGLLAFMGLLLLFTKVIIPFFDWLYPDPRRVLSRMERRDPKEAQEIIDNYSEELKSVAAAAGLMELEEYYFYKLNYTNEYNVISIYEEELQKMPQELADALQHMEEEFPACEAELFLKKGQVGVELTYDGSGFSYLCYPSGELIRRSVIDDEQGTRCLDMGDGWELQMYFAPAG